MKLTEAKQLVTNNMISSIYTKQDVLNLLDKIETEGDMGKFKETLERLKSEFEHGLTFVRDQIVDSSDVTFELDGNKIIVDDVPVDMDIITNVLEELVDELIGNLENQD